jgi:hypothetical protein
MTQTASHTWTGIAIAIAGIAVSFFARDLEWNLIGGAVGLISILIMLGNQAAIAHGYGYEAGEAEIEANKPARIRARTWAPRLAAIGIPLMFLAAWYQLSVVVFERPVLNPDTTHAQKTGNKEVRVWNPVKQLGFNNDVVAAIRDIDNTISELTYPSLLVKNCGESETCECVAPFVKVQDEGGWNLNAGVAGAESAKVKRDSIRLCVAQVKRPEPSAAQ